MSKHFAHLMEFSDRVALVNMQPDALVGQLIAGLEAKPGNRAEWLADYQLTVESIYGYSDFDERKPFVFSNGVAIIPVTGLLVARCGWSCSYMTGYDFIREQMNAALSDPDVKAIAYDHHSPGGSSQMCFELAADIRAGNKVKPSVAMITNSMSGSYALAAAAGKRVAIPSAQVGSIGVYRQHIDYSKALEKEGVKVTFVKEGDHKVDGNPYEPLSAAAKKDWQDTVSACMDEFVTLVSKFTGVSEQAIRDTEARVYNGADAKALGLIDAVVAPGAAMTAYVEKVAGLSKPFSGVSIMSTPSVEQPAASAADAAATARSAERARIAAITGSEEAKGREALATHLAMQTELSADEAKKILAAAPTEKVAAPVEAPAAERREAPFEAAMATNNPEVKPAAPVVEDSVSVRMLKNHAAATGQKVN